MKALSVLLVLALLVVISNSARVMTEGSNSKVQLQKCCDSNKLLFFNMYIQCVPRSNLNITSWSFSPNPDFPTKFSISKIRFPRCSDINIAPFENITLSNNGDVIVANDNYDSSRYCIDQIVYEGGDKKPSDVLLYCAWQPYNATDTVVDRYVVPKCCPPGSAYDNKRTSCVPSPTTYVPQFYDSLTGEPLKMAREDYQIIRYNDSLCESHQEYVIDSSEFYLIQTGELYAPATRRAFPLNRYCVERILSPDGRSIESDIAIVCMEKKTREWAYKDFCKDNICVQKCCPIGQAIYRMEACRDFPDPFIPNFFNNQGQPVAPPENYNITVHPPICAEGYPPLSFDPSREDDKFYVLPNGNIYSLDQGITLAPPNYCIDMFFNESITAFSGSFCSELSMSDDVPPWVYILYPICMIISAMLLAITFLVYLFVPELHNLHGRTLMCYVASLFLAYIILIHSQLQPDSLTHLTCKLTATIMHFAFMSSFFWLNVMCFDIWLTFSSMMTQTGSKAEREKRRFKRYCVYAWGCALILSTIVAVIDNLKNLPPNIIRPRIGYQRCWIYGDMAIFVYFYGPVAVLLASNLVFFALTARQLIKATMETTMVHTTKKNKQRFLLYIKLFLVMGVVWTTEVISWQVGPLEAWYVTDIANTLQGLIIFIIFVCKKKILRKVLNTAKKYYQDCRCCKSDTYRPATDNTPLRKVSNVSSSGHTTSTSLPNSAQIESYSSLNKCKGLK